MADDSRKLLEDWGKPNKRVEAYFKRRRIIIFAVIGAVFLVILGIVLNSYFDIFFKAASTLNSVGATGDWAMFGLNQVHSAAIEPADSLPSGKITTILATNGEIHTSPVIANGTLYIGSADHKLYALDTATGTKRWEFETGSWIYSSPAVVKGRLYFGSNDGIFYALDANSGKKLWDFKTLYAIRSSPAVAGDKVYFGGDDSSIYALNAVNGKKVWSLATGGYVDSSPVVDDGLLFAGSGDSYFYAVDARNGNVRNSFLAVRPVASSPSVLDGVVYFCSGAGYLYAVDGMARNWPWENTIRPNWEALYFYGAVPKPPVKSGFLWGLQLSGATISSPSIAKGILYIGAGKNVVAIDIHSRSKLWEFAAGGVVSTTPVVANNMLYVTSEDGHLYILNAITGEKLMDIPVGGRIVTSPLVYGSTVYVSSTDGNLYSIK